MAKLKLLLYLQVCVAHKLEAARSTERRPNKELGVSIFCDYLDFFWYGIVLVFFSIFAFS